MSIAIGKYNTLRISHIKNHGAYLDADSLGDILLPTKWLLPSSAPGDEVTVFVYRDSEDRLIGTMQPPLVAVGECAFLRVVGFKSGIGTFLDWGLEKDLLLPLREQTRLVSPNEKILVYVRLDERSARIVATMRLQRYLHQIQPRYFPGQRVPLLVAEETPLGYRCIVAQSHFGMLYHSDLPHPLAIGESTEGYIREIRPDGKIDLRLDRSGYGRVAPLAEAILDALHRAGGFLDVHDKTDPERIRKQFGCSKKAFKQAIGSLLKTNQIRIEAAGISQVG